MSPLWGWDARKLAPHILALCGLFFWALNFKKWLGASCRAGRIKHCGISYAGSFIPGAVVGIGVKNRCGAFFVVCH